MYKTCAKELTVNYMENTRRTVVVNLTFMQNAAAKLLQKFLDPITVAKQVFCTRPNPEEFDTFIFKSQRPLDYGGTAPNPTQFWPPIMPPLQPDEVMDENKLNMIKRKDYM